MITLAERSQKNQQHAGS